MNSIEQDAAIFSLEVGVGKLIKEIEETRKELRALKKEISLKQWTLHK